MTFKGLIAAAAGACMVLASTAKAETTINYNIFVPPSHFMWDVMRDWAAQVEDASGGDLKIAFTAKSVAPPPKILDAVRSSAADAGFMANVFSQKFAPGTGVSMQPWIHRGDASAAGVALWRVYNKYFLEHDNWKGVELLGLFQFANANICNTINVNIFHIFDNGFSLGVEQFLVWHYVDCCDKFHAEVGIKFSEKHFAKRRKSHRSG